jgi:hypothetical protein
MPDDHPIEEDLARLAQDPRLKQAMEAASSALSEDELLQYYAGELTEDEARRVGRLAALSPEATQFLAELEADTREAGEATDPRAWWRPLTQPLSSMVRSLRVPHLRLAGAGLVLAIAVLLIVPPLLDRPPEYEGTIHRLSPAFRMGQGKSIAALPDGRNVGLVDVTWPLVAPRGAAEDARWLVWAPIEGATSYRMELIDASGEILLSREGLADAHVEIPASMRKALRPGVEITWLVEAVDGAGEVMVRGVKSFTLGR